MRLDGKIRGGLVLVGGVRRHVQQRRARSRGRAERGNRIVRSKREREREHVCVCVCDKEEEEGEGGKSGFVKITGPTTTIRP